MGLNIAVCSSFMYTSYSEEIGLIYMSLYTQITDQKIKLRTSIKLEEDNHLIGGKLVYSDIV